MFIVVLGLAFLATATEARTKRDTAWVPSDPQAFELKLGFDQVGRIVTTIGMGKPFSKAGNFTFLLSTSSPYAGVAATGCTTCQVDQTPLYNISQSSSAFREATTQTFHIGKGVVSGPVIHESCFFTKGDNSKWLFENQTIIMAETTEGVFGNGSSGFLGLGRSTGNDSYISGIMRSRKWDNVLFGLALDTYDSTVNTTTTQSAGSFNVRELNKGLFNGEVSWQPIAKVTDGPVDIPTDWALKFDSYQLGFGSQNVFSAGGVAIIEPYFPELRIPGSEAIDFFSKIPNVGMTNDTTTLSWTVPCDQDFTVAITVGNNTYRVKKEQLFSLDSTGTVCTSLVKGWADEKVRSYLFGRPFAATAYIAYNAMQNPSSDQIGVAPRAEDTPVVIKQGVSIKTVVASVVGSIVGVAIVAAILFLFIRWRRRRRSDTSRNNRKVKKKYVIEPFTGSPPPNSATPLVSVTRGEGVWTVEQGPIGGRPSNSNIAPMREQWSVESNQSQRGPDSKSPLPIPAPRFNIVRHSQATSPMGLSQPASPEPSPRQEEHPLISTPLSTYLPHEIHDIPDGVAPPPYQRDETRPLP